MKRILLVLLSWSVASVCASAATHAVLPGTSIQAKVDIAAPGDTIAIFGGTYQQNVTIDKSLILVPVEGQSVNIAGDLSLRGSGIIVRDIDTIGTGISTGVGCEATVIGGQHSSITQSTGFLTVHSAEILGNFTTSGDAQKTVAFRTTVNNSVSWISPQSWFGYSQAARFYFNGTGARVVIVGCKIDYNSYNALNIVGSNNDVLVLNSSISFSYYSNYSNSETWAAISINGTGNSAKIFNNYLQNIHVGKSGSGVNSTSADLIVNNNIITNVTWGINAPFGAEAKNNLCWSFRSGELQAGGVIVQDTIYADPLFVEGDAPILQPDSPCINAGTDDPLYANRDGSRNTIGPTGGAWFDPDGWTTENPVVISFDLGPQVLLEGVDTEVLLSNGQAVSQP